MAQQNNRFSQNASYSQLPPVGQPQSINFQQQLQYLTRSQKLPGRLSSPPGQQSQPQYVISSQQPQQRQPNPPENPQQQPLYLVSSPTEQKQQDLPIVQPRPQQQQYPQYTTILGKRYQYVPPSQQFTQKQPQFVPQQQQNPVVIPDSKYQYQPFQENSFQSYQRIPYEQLEPGHIPNYPPVISSSVNLDIGTQSSVHQFPIEPMGFYAYVPYFGPPGLEPFHGIESLSLKKDLELLEVFLGLEYNNRFRIYDSNGELIYYAMELTPGRDRFCLGRHRPFIVNVLDGSGTPVVTVKRVGSCALCWWGSISGTEVTIASPLTGDLYGTIVQHCSCSCSPSYSIYDSLGGHLMSLKGPAGGSACPRCVLYCDAEFDVYDGANLVGTIMKRFDPQQFNSDATYFGMKFPADLDVVTKALLLGAIFTINLIFFEAEGRRTAPCTPGYAHCFIWLVALITIIFVCYALSQIIQKIL